MSRFAGPAVAVLVAFGASACSHNNYQADTSAPLVDNATQRKPDLVAVPETYEKGNPAAKRAPLVTIPDERRATAAGPLTDPRLRIERSPGYDNRVPDREPVVIEADESGYRPESAADHRWRTSGSYRIHERPASRVKRLAWGFNNTVNGAYEGCWLVQKHAYINQAGQYVTYDKVIAQNNTPEALCRVRGAIQAPLGAIEYNPYQRYPMRRQRM